MDDGALALDPAAHAEQPGTEHDAALARRQRSSTEAKGWSPRAPISVAAWALMSPLILLSPSRTAKRSGSSVGSSVESQRLALTQIGRISTPCARASRTI